MKLAIAQLNLVVGDIAGNADRILAAAHEAHAAGAAILLTPEMSICGYPAEDLVQRADFCTLCDYELDRIARESPPEMALIVGLPERADGGLYNSAALVRGGRVESIYRKHHLPSYSVFDEERVFDRGDRPMVFACGGMNFGVAICGDIWEPGPVSWAAEVGADWLLVPNASPFHVGKQADRYAVAQARYAESGLPIVYANQVGGQDELVFDGASFVMDADGEIVVQCPGFVEGLYYVELDALTARGDSVAARPEEAEVWDALVLAVRDYVNKNGFKGIHLGLSGGIDSAVTLAVAVDALGADRAHAVMMPSDYTASISVADSREMVNLVGVAYDEIAIKPVVAAFEAQLAGAFAGTTADTTEENLQARTRGTLLMALSNKFGTLVLTTGNKSEMATGYATLYGDMAGGFAVLKDVPKTLVYRLAVYRNSLSRVIPQRIIDRPPSAELRPDQTDQDSLPPYDVLDAIVAAFVERDLSAREIVAMGYDADTVRRVIRLVDRAEYKRRQAAPGPRVTSRNFSKDRRYPITTAFRPETLLP